MRRNAGREHFPRRLALYNNRKLLTSEISIRAADGRVGLRLRMGFGKAPTQQAAPIPIRVPLGVRSENPGCAH
jgi:hypothetical protein